MYKFMLCYIKYIVILLYIEKTFVDTYYGEILK